jgi:hypothetical protein
MQRQRFKTVFNFSFLDAFNCSNHRSFSFGFGWQSKGLRLAQETGKAQGDSQESAQLFSSFLRGASRLKSPRFIFLSCVVHGLQHFVKTFPNNFHDRWRTELCEKGKRRKRPLRDTIEKHLRGAVADAMIK